ncbi:hypothetical protein [Emticicia sp. BO119]|uniref:Kelch repeat-containing protein n=1 Tax=Emticicia sp. BO119 TaxID=2757768 RepID=UPI0015F05FDF|nr:hypothetical protein [Emticicia sp. BO119]MBA4851448.1 hypothetical protein [Emticicia sp. BO119]
MIRIILTAFILFPLFGINDLFAQSGTLATDGVYVPRMSTVQRNAITAPVNGQMIYNTNEECFNVFQNGDWQNLCGSGLEMTTSDDWTRKADLSTGRQYAVGFSIGDKGYIGTGVIQGSPINPTTSEFWEFNPATNVWTQKANFGGGVRRNAVGFAIGNKGYVGTGDGGTAGDDFWEYNPVTNIWTQKASVGGGNRVSAVGFSIGNKGYIGAGTNKEDFWEYDSTANAWTQKANVSGGARSGAVGFSIRNKGYIGTGINGSTRKADFREYDPKTDTWSQKADFAGNARSHAVGFSIGGKGYVGTGTDGTARNDMWEYNAGNDTWTKKSNFGHPSSARIEGVGFAIGNKGYVGTGNNGGYMYDFWEYNPNLTNMIISGDVNVGGKVNRPIPNFIGGVLQNNWVHLNNGYSTIGYYKDNESVVHLKGMIKDGTAVKNAVIFSLPTGYRPAEIKVFAVPSGEGTFGRIDVLPNGNVQFYSGVNTFLSLDGISFRTAD